MPQSLRQPSNCIGDLPVFQQSSKYNPRVLINRIHELSDAIPVKRLLTSDKLLIFILRYKRLSGIEICFIFSLIIKRSAIIPIQDMPKLME